MKTALSDDNISNVFEECWQSLVEEYGGERIFNAYCSEADVQFHLANKLLARLQLPICVNVEFPLQFDLEDFMKQRWSLGRTRRKMKKDEGIIADIVVMNADSVFPAVIAEIKYDPFIWNYFPILYAVEGAASEEERKEVQDTLPREIRRLSAWENSDPSEARVASYFLKNTSKLIRLLRDFKEQHGELAHAYLCVIGEIYPSLGKVLEKRIAQYNPPAEFKLLFQHYPIREWMMEQLKKLESRV